MTTKTVPLPSAEITKNKNTAILTSEQTVINGGLAALAAAQTNLYSLSSAQVTDNKNLQTNQQALISFLKANNIHDLLNPSGTVNASSLSSTLLAQYNTLYSNYTNDQITLTNTTASVNAANAAVGALGTQITISQNQLNKNIVAAAKGKPLSSTVAPGGLANAAIPDPSLYTYNIPMVSSAYLNKGPQVDSAGNSALIVDPGAYQQVTNAWQSSSNGTFSGAKGSIQASRDHYSAAFSQNIFGSTSSVSLGNSTYGFKFLYNPTSVDMTWGVVEQVNPSFETSGQDTSNLISPALAASTISFSLILNRIGDMSYLNDSGLLPNVGNPYKMAGTPSATDLKDIYEKGTMYDLEFLFRAGGGTNAIYTSGLNGSTADKGFLMPMPIELHLGARLRYLGRIAALDVTHVIFNERMVPIFSTVNVTVSRYFDNPTSA